MFVRASRSSITRRLFSTTKTRTAQSPEEILESGFKQMQSENYKKSDDKLQPLINAGKQLGIPAADIKALYSETNVGDVPFDEMPAEQRGIEARQEIEALKAPSLDQPFKYDELPPLGHLQLHEHRVQREYTRIAAYDLPQLSKYIKEYVPPAKKNVLKFKYVSYLGEDHKAERKVVVTFKTENLKLNKKELHKLRLLAGVRYNPGTDEVKISCARFPDQAQNKRFLGQVVQDLLKNSKDLKDDFGDVPLDFRHIEPKLRRNKSIYPQHEFPKEWERPEDAPKKPQDLVSRITNEL